MAAKKLNPLLALMWKNFRLRLKHPVAWIFEIISPLLFCLLLILLSISLKPVNRPTCDIKAKALPTASGMLFLQTFLCAASNMCGDEESASFGSFNSSLLSTVGEALQKKYNIKSKRSNGLDLNKWSKDFYIIDSLIEAIDNENKKWQLLYNTLLRSSIYSGNSDIENSNIKKLMRIRRNIHTTGVLNSFIRIVTDEDNNSLKNFINLFFCGPDMENIEDQLIQIASELASKQTKEDPDMSKYCNELIENLEKSPFKLILQFFKPLLFGKVVYTPDAPVINRIMERFGESFKKVKDLMDMLKTVKKEWADLRAWKLGEIFNKYRNEEKFLREAVKTKTNGAIMRPYEDDIDNGSGEKALKYKVETFQKILNKTEESYSNYLRETVAETAVSALISALECIDFNKVIAVESEGEALEKANKFLLKDRLWGYIIFTNVPSRAEKLPPSVTYKMRIAPDRSPDTLYKNKVVNKTGVLNSPIKNLKEIEGGTVYLQNMIEGELIREITGRKDIPGIYLNQLPYPCYRQETFLETGLQLLNAFVIFAFIVSYCFIVKRIVIEKDILFKDVLRVFGVSNAHHWIAFFIDAFITGVISVLLVCVILKILFGYFTLFFFFLLAFFVSIIALAFLVSTFFTRSSYCTILALCIYFMLVLFNSLVSQSSSPTGQVFLCFIAVSAVSFGCTWLENMGLSNLPLTVEFINYAPDHGSPITLLLIIFMLLIDGVIYILLAIYFENIISTKTDKKPWNYCFKVSYWKNCCKKTAPRVEFLEPENTRQRIKVDSKNFEAEPDGTVGIEVINVSKEFGKSKNKIRVVNNLSINFYENQITSFLGHNGAGKSTTVLMMTGVLAPTSGTIRIYGVDLRKNPQLALKDVGICLQENVILGELSVRDHLLLIGKLKGLDKNEIKRNLDELLESFELTSRAGQSVRQLSGGWKRKVCIAMAFMGNSRTIFLDEPTAGIDPFARRSVWNVLVKLKKSRTIVLITHHLDEAEILGDRIAIIASGELKCCGSSSFLKSNLDKGYILTVDTTVRTESTPSRKSKDGKKRLSPQAQEMLSTVKSAIPGAEMEEERGCEYIFSLPQKQSSYDLNRLFETLDRNKKKMNINSYGVSAVSLEEVFMKVLKAGEANETKMNNVKKSSSQKSVREPSDGSKSQDSKGSSVEEIEQSDFEKKKLGEREKFRARKLFWNHFVALWIKRGQRCKRHYVFLIIQILLPVIYILLSLIGILIASPKLPLLSVDVSAYDSSVLFYTNDIPTNPHLSSYENALLGPYGLGTKCVLSPKECSLKSIPMGSMVAEGETIASNKCTCEDGKLTCTGNATAEPPEAEMSTGHKLFNMSGLDLHNWLVATEFKYSINRIGGISFGHVSPFTGVSVADFLNLFPGKGLLQTLEKYISGGPKQIDPNQFTSDLMAGVNDDYGGKLFKDKDSADNIIIWFNSKDKIASMALINGVTNLVLRASLPNGTDPSSYSIQLVVDPFPARFSNLASSRQEIMKTLVMSLLHSLAFLFALIIIYLVEERSSGMKHLALISGVNPLVYWCAYFLWDIVIFSIDFVLLLLLLVIFNVTSFCGLNTLPVFTALLYSYAVTTLIFLYIMSNLFSKTSSAIIFVFIWIAVVGALSFLICTIFFDYDSYKWIIKIFMLIPECCLALCLYNLTKYGDEGMIIKVDYFQWDTTTQYIIRILINGGVYLIILLLMELRNVQPLGIITKLFMSLKLLLRRPSKKVEDDDDVNAEKERVRSNKAKEEGDLFIMKNLTKIYCGQRQPAANHVYVGVKRGECLGLLGMNGAGKTTIFKMITGTTNPTVGDATIGGFSITYSPIKSRILIGYCPQINALDPYLTPVEHLSFFCRIRGYDKKGRIKETDMLIELLNLSDHKTKISKALSGGNQRKLNAAIAFLSEPELILLDEPTAGMDVLARRFLWSRLLDVLQDGRCLVLTTHSMEECQALATQVCIMFQGRFLCFGTSQHLKNKFNDGYSVSLRLVNADNYKDIINYLNDNLAGYTIVSIHILHVKIKLHPDTNIGKAVNIMGELKKKQWIEDYSINQTTLETVFLNMIGEVDRTKAFQKPCCSC